ncbi:MAG: uracil-DNA glycosylase, partial [Actinobacteria bacterium]|nr:uracil-DNA glycosylase [Actinomycetota bacterium]
GWERFTQSIVEYVAKSGAIGILWGKQALELAEYFNKDSVITAAHPSPLSAYRGFFGSKPFSTANSILAKKQLTPIKW